MDNYFNSYREMISLRGLADHTLKSYCTYIRAYLDYLQRILHKQPEDVSWQELRDFIKWLQNTRSISDRTVNTAISQLRFFTMYVLHKPWDDTQLPMRKFDIYLPFVPSHEEAVAFITSISDLKQKAMISLILHQNAVTLIRFYYRQKQNIRHKRIFFSYQLLKFPLRHIIFTIISENNMNRYI